MARSPHGPPLANPGSATVSEVIIFQGKITVGLPNLVIHEDILKHGRSARLKIFSTGFLTLNFDPDQNGEHQCQIYMKIGLALSTVTKKRNDVTN